MTEQERLGPILASYANFDMRSVRTSVQVCCAEFCPRFKSAQQTLECCRCRYWPAAAAQTEQQTKKRGLLIRQGMLSLSAFVEALID